MRRSIWALALVMAAAGSASADRVVIEPVFTHLDRVVPVPMVWNPVHAEGQVRICAGWDCEAGETLQLDGKLVRWSTESEFRQDYVQLKGRDWRESIRVRGPEVPESSRVVAILGAASVASVRTNSGHSNLEGHRSDALNAYPDVLPGMAALVVSPGFHVSEELARAIDAYVLRGGVVVGTAEDIAAKGQLDRVKKGFGGLRPSYGPLVRATHKGKFYQYGQGRFVVVDAEFTAVDLANAILVAKPRLSLAKESTTTENNSAAISAARRGAHSALPFGWFSLLGLLFVTGGGAIFISLRKAPGKRLAYLAALAGASVIATAALAEATQSTTEALEVEQHTVDNNGNHMVYYATVVEFARGGGSADIVMDAPIESIEVVGNRHAKVEWERIGNKRIRAHGDRTATLVVTSTQREWHFPTDHLDTEKLGVDPHAATRMGQNGLVLRAQFKTDAGHWRSPSETQSLFPGLGRDDRAMRTLISEGSYAHRVVGKRGDRIVLWKLP